MIEAVATGTDPSRAPFSESTLSENRLREYVTNVVTGCRHGCRFYYVPTTPPYRYHTGKLERVDVDDPRTSGVTVLYRNELPEQPESAVRSIDAGDRAFETTDRGRGVFGISYSTIRFIDGPTGGITRQCVESLVEIDGREQHWIGSQLKHFRWVQAVGAELGLPDHLWPDDQLINNGDVRTGRGSRPGRIESRPNPSPAGSHRRIRGSNSRHAEPQPPVFGGGRRDGCVPARPPVSDLRCSEGQSPSGQALPCALPR